MKYLMMCWAGLVAGMMTDFALGAEEGLAEGLYLVRVWSEETARRDKLFADSEKAFESIDLFKVKKTDAWPHEPSPSLNLDSVGLEIPPLPVELDAELMDTEADYRHQLKIRNKVEKARLLPLPDFKMDDVEINVDEPGIAYSITMQGWSSLLAQEAKVLAIMKDSRRVLGEVGGWQDAGGKKRTYSIRFSIDGMTEAQVLELLRKMRQQFLFSRLSSVDPSPPKGTNTLGS